MECGRSRRQSEHLVKPRYAPGDAARTTKSPEPRHWGRAFDEAPRNLDDVHLQPRPNGAKQISPGQSALGFRGIALGVCIRPPTSRRLVLPAPTGQNKSAQGNPPWVSEASPWESARRARRARCRDRDPRGVRRWQSRGARSRGKSSGERQASDRPGSFAMIHRSEPARSTVAESCRHGRGMMILSPPSSCLSLKEASLESSHARHHRNHR
jgi:hypothetical protein